MTRESFHHAHPPPYRFHSFPRLPQASPFLDRYSPDITQSPGLPTRRTDCYLPSRASYLYFHDTGETELTDKYLPVTAQSVKGQGGEGGVSLGAEARPGSIRSAGSI